MRLGKCGEWKAPVGAVEGVLPKEAGANFTGDSVHLNLRSVFGEGGGWGGEGSWEEGLRRNLRKRRSGNRAIFTKGSGEVRDVQMMEGKWKNVLLEMSLNTGGEECFAQRAALIQDECQVFRAGSVIYTCNGPNDDKICLCWKNLVQTLTDLFGTMTFKYPGYECFTQHLRQHWKTLGDNFFQIDESRWIICTSEGGWRRL